jgi:hypothetical protein
VLTALAVVLLVLLLLSVPVYPYSRNLGWGPSGLVGVLLVILLVLLILRVV